MNELRIATTGSPFGKNNVGKISPPAMAYSPKSYHSMTVPTVLATTARRRALSLTATVVCPIRQRPTGVFSGRMTRPSRNASISSSVSP